MATKKQRDEIWMNINYYVSILAAELYDRIEIPPGDIIIINGQCVGLNICFRDVGMGDINDESALCTFADLQTISELFGTKMINLNPPEVREGGYCETCAYSYKAQVVYVTDIWSISDRPNNI